MPNKSPLAHDQYSEGHSDDHERISLEDALRKFGVKEPYIKAALQRMRVTKESLTEVMRSSDYGFVSPETIAQITAYMQKMDYKDPRVIEEVNHVEIREHVRKIENFEGYVPIGISPDKSEITVAISERSMINSAQDFFEKFKIKWCIASNRTIQSIYRQFFANTAEKFDQTYRDLEQIDFEVEMGQESVDMVIYSMIRHACYMEASDIMIHPMRKNTGAVVLLKIGGVGELFRYISWDIYVRIINKFKLYSGGQVDRLKTTPMEGKLEISERVRKDFPEIIDRYSFRVQMTCYAEAMPEFVSVAIRILDQQSEVSDFKQLGIDDETAKSLENFAHTSHGLFLVCGATGSGKTSTLYAWLNLIDPIDRWVQSIENPVEYSKGLWMQYQIPKNGLSERSNEVDGAKLIFKSLLRNAPDVILAGEVRDAEITEIVIDLANTGHLAATTFHTNNAALSISRLKNFGLDMTTLASILLGIFAQRLVRVLCPQCKLPDNSEEVKDALNKPWLSQFEGKAFKASSTGCPHCDYKGYRGRRMVYELLQITPEIREMIENGSPPSAIAKRESQRTRPYALMPLSWWHKASHH